MKSTIVSRSTLNGCLVLILLLVIGSTQYAAIQELVRSSEWVAHTLAVGKQLGTVETGLSKGSTAARRFVTTGDSGFLGSYHSDVQNLWAGVGQLEQMVADNPGQETMLFRLKPLIKGRVGSLDQVIATRQKGGSSAAGIAELDRIALLQMDPIRQVFDDMRDSEDRLLVARNARAAEMRRRASVVVVLGSLFAVAIVLWGAVTLRRDVAKRNRAEAELGSSHEALRDLSGRLLQEQDEERRRLARELHDGTSQILAAAQLRLIALRLAIPPENERAQSALVALSELAERCSREIRTMSHLLHPPLLEHTGVGSAIRWYVEEFSERSGIKVDVQAAEDWPRFSLDTETALFRITQEALTNIHRHSGSSTARIRAGLEDGRIRLEISDEGRGIPADILDTPARFGVGLRGMTERVRLLGGKLTIESGRVGTTVRADLPAATRDGTKV